MQIVVDQAATILEVLSFRQHVRGDQDADFLRSSYHLRRIVGLRSEGFDDPAADLRIFTAIHAPDDYAPKPLPEFLGVFGLRMTEILVKVEPPPNITMKLANHSAPCLGFRFFLMAAICLACSIACSK